MSKGKINQLLHKAQTIRAELQAEHAIIYGASYKINQKLNELADIQCKLISLRSNYDSTDPESMVKEIKRIKINKD